MSSHHEENHSRTQFQIDRIAFFSDAVIAIALTLMILEVKIPEFGTNAQLRDIFRLYGTAMLVHGLALFVAFWTIGNLWMRHHRLFEHIVNYSGGMIRINLIFLFTVMLLPISISFLFANNQPYSLRLLIYFTNLFLTSFSYSLLLLVVYNRKEKFSSLKDFKKIRAIKQKSFLGSLVFLVTIILILFDRSWFWAAFLLMPLSKLVSRIGSKKDNKEVTTARKKSVAGPAL